MRQRLAKAWSGLQVLQYMNQRLLAAELQGGDAGAVGSRPEDLLVALAPVVR